MLETFQHRHELLPPYLDIVAEEFEAERCEYIDQQGGSKVWQSRLAGRGPAISPAFDSVLEVPVHLGGTRAGVLRIVSSGPFRGDEVTLARSLAAQLGLALEARRPATGNPVTGVAPVSTVRGEEAMRLVDCAISALRRATSRLAEAGEAAVVMRETLRAVVEVLRPQGVISAGVAELVESRRVLKYRAFIRGENELPPDDPYLMREWPIDDPAMLGPWSQTTTGFSWGRTSDPTVLHPAARPYHEAQGAAAVAYVSLQRGGRPTGFVGFSLREAAAPSSEQVWLMQALAAQIASAIEMQRLSGEALAAATSRERALAAERRAAELAVASEAFHSSLLKVSSGPVDRAPEAILVQLAQAARALACAWYTFHPDGQTLEPQILIAEGRVHSRADQRASLFGGHPSTEVTPERSTLPDTDLSAMSEWLLCHGHQVRHVVQVGEEKLGLVIMSFEDPGGFDTVQDQLVRSLCDQFVLALQLSRLARFSRDAETARAVAAERARMAGEIHDSLAQSFTSIALQSESLLSDLEHDSPIRPTLEVIEQTARLGLVEARNSVLSLRSVGDAVGELQNALLHLAERCNISGSLTCRFRTSSPPCPLAPDLRDSVLRVAQEAASNALKHAGATTLLIEFNVRDGQATLEVTDDGRGISDLAHGSAGGSGIFGMRARAHAVGGDLVLERGPGGRGTTVRMVAPAGSTPAG